MQQKRLTVLHVEDEENDVLLVRMVAQRCAPLHHLHAVADAEQAMQYLNGDGSFSDRQAFPLPDLIITDLKMPRMSGFDLLRWLRAHQMCPLIPTIVLSSSAEPNDVFQAYRLGANSYLAKPSSLAELEVVLHTLFHYWENCQRPGSAGHY